MNRSIVCTVGTSLLTNAGWKRGQLLPDATGLLDWLASADPKQASAETNSLQALNHDASDALVFLQSETEEGRFCAEVLEAFYRRTARSVVRREIGRLGYGADRFTAGLKSLVELAIHEVEDARRAHRTPVFCATGGFKAEIAFLNLLGALLGIEVVYIHELHRELVRLPRLPLVWDAEFVAHHQDFFEWIEEDLRRSSEVESWLKARPELRALVEDDGEGNTLLTAAGALLFRAAREQLALGPRAVWPEADPRPPAEKNQVSGMEHHRPKGWERFVLRLCSVDCVSLVRYDESAYGGPPVKILDPEKGILTTRFGDTGKELPLRMETTARGATQCELVASYLGRLR